MDAAHVFLEVRQLEERGRTELTLERLFARVQSDVQLECRRVGKGLFAYLALVLRNFKYINFRLIQNTSEWNKNKVPVARQCAFACGL